MFANLQRNRTWPSKLSETVDGAALNSQYRLFLVLKLKAKEKATVTNDKIPSINADKQKIDVLFIKSPAGVCVGRSEEVARMWHKK